MPLIRKSDILKLRNLYVHNYGREKLSEIINQHKRKSEEGEITVFLSHKHSEKEILIDVIAFLNTLGIKIYVDWLDDEMPAATSGYTALRLRSKIKENRKFILLATEGAIKSVWCNWELGYGDAQKWVSHIALLPIAENDGTWEGNEYLQIYPVIKYDETTREYVVESKALGSKKLEDWLKS